MGFQNIEFHLLFFVGGGGVQKNEYFGYDDSVDILLGSSQNWTDFIGHFLRMRIFFGLLNFQIFLGGMPDIPEFFGG